MNQPHTKDLSPLVIVIENSGRKQRRLFPAKHLKKLETFLDTYGDTEIESVSWDELAKNRISKHKKAGLVLRGARYREGISQKELARRSGISQENISKMENGLRPIGEKVAKALAKALHITVELLLL